MTRLYRVSFLLMFTAAVFVALSACAQPLQLTKNNMQKYSIVISDDAGKNDKTAAIVLQKIIKQSMSVDLPLLNESVYHAGNPAIVIGKANLTKKLTEYAQLKDDGYALVIKDGNVYIAGKSGHAAEYGVYYFAEQYLGCRKYDAGPALISNAEKVTLPQSVSFVSNPSFIYRESYYPAGNNAEYLNWHALQRFEDLWGLWGHSYFKLVPPKKYFSLHPEYYALVNGSRKATQLCLSNPHVLEIVVAALKQRMIDNPDALYWSISPEDGGGYCTCDLCQKTDKADGAPSGSLIKFVNQVAAAFPDKKITTLAYGYTAKAPLNTRPAANVVILLSTIDAYREQPLKDIPSAADFRKNLEDWNKKSQNIFVWDYCTQFTNYVSPFPAIHNAAADFSYFNQQHISGVFEQGSGETYADCAELNSYVQAKLLWNASLDVQTLITDFCKGYYQGGADFVLQYLQSVKQNLDKSNRHLDIYGNPILEMKSFLQPEVIVAYKNLLDKAVNAATDPVVKVRIQRLGLPLEYAALQQSRSFGPEEYGFLQSGKSKLQYEVKPDFLKRVTDFVTLAKSSGVKELSEGGLTPDTYLAEWNGIFKQAWPVNLAYNAKLTLQYPFAEDYPAKGLRTLTDGMTGFGDFSYNWLCFYGTDMVADMDAGKELSFSVIKLHFLDDPRHWIFLPKSVQVAYSADGVHYSDWVTQTTVAQAEHDSLSIKAYTFELKAKARFIKVMAKNNATLPEWRNYSNKKPMVACDEVFVLP